MIPSLAGEETKRYRRGCRRRSSGQAGERLLDANRTIGQPNKITVIFGRRISKHYRGKLQTEIEDMDLPNSVIRSHYGNGFIKQYVRDHLILRTEAASNNVLRNAAAPGRVSGQTDTTLRSAKCIALLPISYAPT